MDKNLNKTRHVVFARSANSPADMPETYVYTGHKEDALFEFIYQTLGYTITVVESNDKISAEAV